MRDDDGRKLDHKTLEQLRIRAVGQIEHGAHPEDVAAALGMTKAAVYGWLAKYREAFALWTRAIVRELIRREFGAALSEVSVGRLLGKLGLSPQRPLYRAYQQNPQAVARWKAEI